MREGQRQEADAELDDATVELHSAEHDRDQLSQPSRSAATFILCKRFWSRLWRRPSFESCSRRGHDGSNCRASRASLDGLIRLWRRLARDAAEHAGNEAVALLTPSVSWVPTTIFTALPSMTRFLFFLVVLLACELSPSVILNVQ